MPLSRSVLGILLEQLAQLLRRLLGRLDQCRLVVADRVLLVE